MFYIQRVLADFWGRKDSVHKKFTLISYAQRSNMHRCACDWHKSRYLFDLNSLPNALFIKHKYAQDDYNWMN